VNPIQVIVQTGRPAVGIYLKSPNAPAIEIAAAVGLDFVRLDLQHGWLDLPAAKDLIRAIRAAGLTASVRAPQDEAVIEQIIAAGTEFITFPGVNRPDEARQLASWCSNATPDAAALVSIQIESTTGLENLTDIVSTPGIDMIQCGRSDLAKSLGLTINDRELELDRIEELIASEAHRAGRLTSAHCPPGPGSTERAQRWIERGVSCLTLGSDTQLLRWTLRETLHDLTPIWIRQIPTELQTVRE
jgi:4-hydroxy-2-oxoheptanedioate aldolase